MKGKALQTFLPYSDFVQTAHVLDRQRLGKQRVEAYQVLRTLTGESAGWKHHPAVKMWRGYEPALAMYGWVMCNEWINRGYQDSLSDKFLPLISIASLTLPAWVGDECVHRSHQSNLVRKLPEHYAPWFPGVPDDLPYVWPV